MRGYTLIEALVYTALFSLVLGAVLSGVQSLTEFSERSLVRALLESEGDFLMAKIALDASPLTDTKLVGSMLMRTSSSSSIQLSSSAVSVSSVTFSRITGGFSTRFILSATTSRGQVLSQTFFASSYFFP